MFGIKELIAKAIKANEKFDDYIYATQLLAIAPNLSELLGINNVELGNLDLTDKIANTQKFKRFRKQLARIYVDIARNSIKFQHSKVVDIFIKAQEINPMDDKTVLQDFIIYEFNYGIDDGLLKSLINDYFNKFEKWSKDDKNKLIHSINICIKILEDDKKSAINWLKGYSKEFGPDGLQQIPLVAYFAHNHGVSNELIQKSAYIAGEVLRTRQDELFERYVQDQKISIVGNGPQNLGTKLGSTIDNSNVVVRFNNGVVSKFKEDYGTKINVWVRNNASPYDNYKNLKKCKFCILIDSIERMHWKDEQIKVFYDQLFKSPCRLLSPSREFLQRIFRKYDFSRFTSGLLAVAFICELSKNSEISLYGFSSMDERLKNSNSFYDQKQLSFYGSKSANLEAGFLNHSFEMEKKLMTELRSKIHFQ